MFIHRTLESSLRRAARQFPAVAIGGPRQSGKTTLLRQVFKGRVRHYVSLETPDVRAAALADPRGFLRAHPPPVILDEIQYAPELLPYIKETIDASRDQPGQFLLTVRRICCCRSTSPNLSPARRHAAPASLSSRGSGSPDRPFPGETPVRQTREKALWPSILRGGYPEIVRDPSATSPLARQLCSDLFGARRPHPPPDRRPRQSRSSFARSPRNGQLLDLSNLSRDIGVAVNTAKAWLSVLQATWQVSSFHLGTKTPASAS